MYYNVCNLLHSFLHSLVVVLTKNHEELEDIQ